MSELASAYGNVWSAKVENGALLRKRISEIINSCRSERGGFTRHFFECFHVDVPRSFAIPPGWKSHLEFNVAIEEVESYARRYQQEVAAIANGTLVRKGKKKKPRQKKANRGQRQENKTPPPEPEHFFPRKARKSKQGIIRYLVKQAKMYGHCAREQREQMRKDFLAKPRNFYLGASCVACGARAEVRHHVRPLGHGGDNRRSNVVMLCESCHAEIHPWLEVSPSETDIINSEHLSAIAAEAGR
jgi:5-methylcytosine-specific restriction endonuclease McrA